MHRLEGTRAPWLLAVYAGLAVLNIAGTAAFAPLAAATKPLLMPVLLAWVLANAVQGSRPAVALMAGLFCAFLGDVLLMADERLWGIAAFALMQVAYLVAFRLLPGPGLVRAWPLAAVPYALAWAGFTALLWPSAGDLRIPVAAYGALLYAMALAALGLALRLPPDMRWWPAAGGALFIASDAVLALGMFGVGASGAPAGAFAMAAYCAAQFLIVVPVVIAERRRPAA